MWCFIIPYSVATGQDDGTSNFLWVFSIVVDVSFWADLVISFITSYPDPTTGKPVTDRGKIVKNYLTGWFLIDFVSVFPFEPIIKAAMAGDATDDLSNITSIGKTARLARVSKIFRLVRFLKLLL
jgi:hypothetical protein